MEKTKVQSYTDLINWQKAKDLAVMIYKATDAFPSKEVFGLTAQVRRAAISIPSNIAEGFRRKSKKEKLQFLRIAYGSGAEVETQLIIAKELQYLTKDQFQGLSDLLNEIMSMLNKVISNFEEHKA